MAVVFTEDFDGLADGTLITAANTAFDANSGDGTSEADTAFSITGGVSCAFICATTSENVRLDDTFTATGSRWFRWYFRPPAPLTLANRPRLAALFSGGTHQAGLLLENDGTLSIMNGPSVAATSTTAVTPGEWNRIEWGVVNGGNNELRLFVGANLHGTVPDETVSAAYSEGTFDSFTLGPWVARDAWTHHVDSVVADDTAFPGPAVTEFEETFNGLTDEEVITSANTNFNAVLGVGAAVADTAFSAAGGVAARLATTVDGDTVILEANFSATDPIAFRYYFRPDFYPATGAEGETNIGEARSIGKDIRAMMEFGENGTIGIKDFNRLVATSSTVLPIDEWTRIEWRLDGVTDTQACRLFVGSNLHGTIPDEEFSGLFTEPSDVDELWVGNVRSNNAFALTAWWDEIKVDTDWIGPALVLVPPGITSSVALGTPSLAASITVSPTGVLSSAALGTPSLSFEPPDQLLEVTGVASVRAVGQPTVSQGILITISEVGGIASKAAVGVPGLNDVPVSVFIFIPPTTREGPAGAGVFFERFALIRGISVIKRLDGTFYQTRFPAQEELEAADLFYIGGHEYVIDEDAADELIVAGYGDNIIVRTA